MNVYLTKLLCGRCTYETNSLPEYMAHIATHYQHAVVIAPVPSPAPEWHPTLSREIL